jgi:hypothetical protein
MGGKQSSISKTTRFSELNDIDLEEMETGRVFKSDDLWEDPSKVTIVHIIRRPGCQLCREQAQLLADLVEFSMPEVTLIGNAYNRNIYSKSSVQDLP